MVSGSGAVFKDAHGVSVPLEDEGLHRLKLVIRREVTANSWRFLLNEEVNERVGAFLEVGDRLNIDR